jgi:coenzyme PQQ precursor peptide PqqA
LFCGELAQLSEFPCAPQQGTPRLRAKDLTGELLIPHYLIPEDGNRPFEKESQMAWKTPKIVEVPVGMEINMYACAARK